MGDHSTGEATPHWAVLGLISQGRTTVAALRDRLDREFPKANYPPNAARTVLQRLAEKGQARLVREGDAPAESLYEITTQGQRELDGWVYEVIPPLRDAMHAKLTFLEPSQIARLIEAVRLCEDAALRSYGVEKGEASRLTLRGVDGNSRLELQLIKRRYTSNLWGQEAKRLTALRHELEELQAKLPPVTD
jgi:DNA-binding PadR family transcriptional regulator